MRLWDDFTATDSQYTGFQVAVGLFYTYFAIQEIREFYDEGWAYWKEYLNIAQTTNIILYIYATAASALAPSLFPSNEDIGLGPEESLMGHMFVDFGPVSESFWSSRYTALCCIYCEGVHFVLNAGCVLKTKWHCSTSHERSAQLD